MSFINAMDNFTPKSIGKNGHVQYSWSNNMNEKILQFYYQLVRRDERELSFLETRLDELLTFFKQTNKENQTVPTYIDELSLLYKLIAHTRDIIDGKGEYLLTYMQLFVWNKHFPRLAQIAFDKCMFLENYTKVHSSTSSDKINLNHPYGSWKDVKYFCHYVKQKVGNEDHSLIHYAIRKLVGQLRNDLTSYNEGKHISLASKWCPREKGKFSWLYKYIVREMYPEFFASRGVIKYTHSWNDYDIHNDPAYKKGARELRKILSMMNSYIDTTQIKMCNDSWSKINFNNVTSITMHKEKYAFLNRTKNGLIKKKTSDRKICAENLKKHIDCVKSNTSNKHLHGKRVNVYQFVKDAITCRNSTLNDSIEDIINEQWKDNATQNKGLKNFIAMVDTSGSMSQNNNIPLYNSIGLAIRISELSNSAFKDRILTFSATPEWINLSGFNTFTDKVVRVVKSDWGMNTNFYKAMRMILDASIDAELSPKEVEHMALIVLSDMQFDVSSKEDMNVVYDNIEEMYRLAGLKTKYKTPYTPPHIVFWNLQSTDGFPVLSSQKNVTMISGYNSSLLNIFCEHGLDSLKNYSPMNMLYSILNNKRYSIMDAELFDYFDTIV